MMQRETLAHQEKLIKTLLQLLNFFKTLQIVDGTESQRALISKDAVVICSDKGRKKNQITN